MTDIKQADDMLKGAVPIQPVEPPKPRSRFFRFLQDVLFVLRNYTPPPPGPK